MSKLTENHEDRHIEPDYRRGLALYAACSGVWLCSWCGDHDESEFDVPPTEEER